MRSAQAAVQGTLMSDTPKIEVLSRDEMIVRAFVMCHELRTEMDAATRCIKQLQERVVDLEKSCDHLAYATLESVSELRTRISKLGVI